MNRFVPLAWWLLVCAGGAAEEASAPAVTSAPGAAVVPAAVAPVPAPDYAYARRQEEGLKAKWNVRIEVVMIGVPQEKYLALLPDLHDEGKIEGVVAQLLAAISRKEAVLMGWPIVQTLDGMRAMSETIDEKRYPTEFEPPTAPPAGGPPPPTTPPSALVDQGMAMPTAFETRNVGVTLEAEPRVLGNGDWIDVSLVPQRVDLKGYDKFASQTKRGHPSTIEQPQFFTTKVQTELKVRNGERVLLAVHLLSKPESFVELVFLQAFATEAAAEVGTSPAPKKP